MSNQDDDLKDFKTIKGRLDSIIEWDVGRRRKSQEAKKLATDKSLPFRKVEDHMEPWTERWYKMTGNRPTGQSSDPFVRILDPDRKRWSGINRSPKHRR